MELHLYLYTNPPPPRNAVEESAEDHQKTHYKEISEYYEHNEYFYEIAVDPGNKTNIAAERRNFWNGVEPVKVIKSQSN